MIILLLVFLFLCKFDYPSILVDILIAIVLVLILISILYTIYTSCKVKIDFNVQDKKYYASDDVIASSSISGVPFIGLISIRVSIKNLQTNEHTILKLKNISQSSLENIELKCLPAGTYSLGVDRIIIMGFFKIFRLFKKLNYSTTFDIFPIEVEESETKLKNIVLNNEGQTINKPGNDYSEIYEIREFVDGDNLKHIHRTLSAKFDNYMIKVGSFNDGNLKVYQIKDSDDFKQVVNELGKCYYFFRNYVVDQNALLCLNYENNWSLIMEEDDLDNFTREVYREFIKES